MHTVLTDMQDITQMRVIVGDTPQPGPGDTLLRIDHFALTANNVTYAATGKVLKYWNFYPSGVEGAGIVPVWGGATVVAGDLPAGTRLYGYWPMASHAVLRLHPAGPGLWVERSAHRADLALVYNSYNVIRGEDETQDHLRALLQPLLATSYLLFDWLADNDWFGAEQIIVGSASSKTGLGLCLYLAEPDARPYRVVGLTGAGNVDFVAKTGACDAILTYDHVADIARVPSVYVDMAGHAGVKAALHGVLGNLLRHSAAVGTSHWDQFAPPAPDLPGPKPQFFFAPSQIAKRRAEWGPGEIERRITAAWKRVAAQAGDWMEVQTNAGLARVPAIWSDLAAGRARPDIGQIVIL